MKLVLIIALLLLNIYTYSQNRMVKFSFVDFITDLPIDSVIYTTNDSIEKPSDERILINKSLKYQVSENSKKYIVVRYKWQKVELNIKNFLKDSIYIIKFYSDIQLCPKCGTNKHVIPNDNKGKMTDVYFSNRFTAWKYHRHLRRKGYLTYIDEESKFELLDAVSKKCDPKHEFLSSQWFCKKCILLFDK